MRKALLSIAALLTAAALTACGKSGTKIPEIQNDNDAEPDVELTLWTFPVGNWGNATAVTGLLDGFHKKYPGININVEYVLYEDGDAKIEQAIADGNGPDLVMEGPERLVTNWGEKGLMADLSDLWESEKAGQIYGRIKEACQHKDGAYYEFPICMTAHCMAINYEMFQEAGALQYIDEEARTWTTEDFVKAVKALRDHGQECVGAIYCKNQTGDQGTRALVNNLFKGSFADETHTYYTVDSEENVKALELLYGLEGITFEPSISAVDAIDLFCNKESAMVFCWNGFLEIQQTISNPDLDFDIFPMTFPSSDGQPQLQAGIWGFGIFDNGDERKIEAAKDFIRYMTEDDAQYTRAVRTSLYWPVRKLDNIYENDQLMAEYSDFGKYVGDYYQITPGWAHARTAWWKMLQKIGEGADISKAVKAFPVTG